MTFHRGSIALAAAWLACACGTETGNGLVTMKAGLTAEGGAPTGADAQGTVFTITTARASLKHVEMHRPGGKEHCDGLPASNTARVKCDGGKLRVNGPIVADLIAETTTPDLSALEIPPDTYKRVDLRLEEAKIGDGLLSPGDPLLENTLVVSGTLAYPAGMTTTFDLALAFKDDVRFESDPGIVIEEATAQDVILRLDVARWFTALPITSCIEVGDLEIVNGHVVIDDTAGGPCNGVKNALKGAIKDSGKLEKK